MNSKTLTTAAALAALLLAYGIVCTSDFEDAVAADQHYREMVCAGYWPDYDDRKPDCSAQIARLK